MAVPKQHRSKSRQGQRRMHIYLAEKKTQACPKCGKPVLPHTVCKSCGFYKGREVINVLAKLDKKERKKKEKEMKEKEQEQEQKQQQGPLSMEQLSKKQ